MESFEHTGRFWLPGHDDRPIAGVLSFDPEDGVELALIGALHEDRILGTPHAVDRLILGLAGRAEVTLVGCWLQSNPWDMPGWLEETWIPHMALRGAWFDDTDELAFDSVYFAIDALLEWTNRGHITRDYRDDERHRPVGAVIQHSETPAESIELEDGGMLGIRFPWSTEGDSVRHSAIRQGCVIHRSWTDPQPLDDILTEIRLFQHLLTIAVNEACRYRAITLQHPDVVSEATDRVYREPIEFYATQGKPLAETPHPMNMLFCLDDLGGIDGLKRWRDIASNYARALDMVTSIRYLPTMFGENKLANATSAAEALHRVIHPRKAIDDDLYAGLKRTMLKTVADIEHRNHLGQQLRHANEHFLSTRLRHLAEQVGPASDSVVGGDAQRWARLVANIRNSLTHPEDADDDDRPDVKPSDFLFLSESVYLVTVLCILRQAGLSNERLVSAVQRMSVQWAAKEIPGVLRRLSPLVDKRR